MGTGGTTLYLALEVEDLEVARQKAASGELPNLANLLKTATAAEVRVVDARDSLIVLDDAIGEHLERVGPDTTIYVHLIQGAASGFDRSAERVANALPAAMRDRTLSALTKMRNRTAPAGDLRTGLLLALSPEGERDLELERLATIATTSALIRQRDVPESMMVSVVMPTRNRSARVLEAIASVQAQRYRCWELLIVDDGSDDDTSEVLARAAANDDRLRPLHTPHSGPAVARNHALDRAVGDVIAYLDDDNRFDPDWLHAVVWAFSTHTDRDVLYGARLVDDIDRHRTGVAGGEPWVQFLPWDRTAADFNRVDMNVLAHRRSSERFDVSVDYYSDWDLLTRLSAKIDPFELPVIATYYTTDGPDRMTTSTQRAEIDRQYAQVRDNIARRGAH